MIHGDIDERVPPKLAYSLEDALKAKKCAVERKMYQRVGHVFVPASPVDLWDAQKRIDAFFKTHLQDTVAKKVGK